MLFGLFTSGYQFQDLEKAFVDAKAFGYDFIELWGGYPHAYPWDMDEKRIATIRSYSEKYGIPIRVYTPEHNAYPYNYMLADERQLGRIRDYFIKSIEVAAALGSPYMLLSVGQGDSVSATQRQEKLLSFLRELLPQAEKNNVILLLETLTPYESNTCTTLAELKSVLQSIASPYLQGMCDVVAAYSQEETLMDYQQALQEKFAHVHFVDADGVSETHLLPGEGILPLADILQYLKQMDYRGGLTVELVTHYMAHQSEAFQKALARIKEIMHV